MNLAAWLNEYETMSRQLMCFTAEWNEQKKIDTFMKHMRIVFPDIRVACRELRPDNDMNWKLSYEEARRVAIEEEETMRQRDHHWRSGAKAVFKTHPLKRKGKFNGDSTGGRYRQGVKKCYNCRRPGHMIKDCREPPQWQAPRDAYVAPPPLCAPAAEDRDRDRDRDHRRREKSTKRTHDRKHHHHKSSKKQKKSKHGARKARKESSSSRSASESSGSSRSSSTGSSSS